MSGRPTQFTSKTGVGTAGLFLCSNDSHLTGERRKASCERRGDHGGGGGGVGWERGGGGGGGGGMLRNSVGDVGGGGVPKQRVGVQRIELIRAHTPRNRTLACMGQVRVRVNPYP